MRTPKGEYGFNRWRKHSRRDGEDCVHVPALPPSGGAKRLPAGAAGARVTLAIPALMGLGAGCVMSLRFPWGDGWISGLLRPEGWQSHRAGGPHAVPGRETAHQMETLALNCSGSGKSSLVCRAFELGGFICYGG